MPLPTPISWSTRGISASAKNDYGLRAAALLVAVVAHLVVLYTLMRAPDDPLAGGGGQQIDAISVTIVSSKVLEARSWTTRS